MPDEFIPLSVPQLEGRVQAYLDECLRTNFVSSVGPFVDRFEKEFAAYVGSPFAVACSSGTAALHVAMRLLGVQSGDDVFVSTLTFIASANPIIYQGATPVFVDAERETWNLDPDLIIQEMDRRAKSGEKQPKAVEAVHILGHPASLERLSEACAQYNVPIIEDAAEALGARYIHGKHAGRHVGTIGKIGCYSFNGNKIITTGGGGMIVTDDESLAKRAKHLTTQAKLPGAAYRHDDIGYNYRLTNLAAALGVSQLECISKYIDRKKRIAERYDRAFENIKGLTLPPRAAWAESTGWLYTILVKTSRLGESLDDFVERLNKQNIQSRPIWSPLHGMPMYRHSPRLGGLVAEELAGEGLSLPCSVGLTDDQQKRVIEAVLERFDR